MIALVCDLCLACKSKKLLYELAGHKLEWQKNRPFKKDGSFVLYLSER